MICGGPNYSGGRHFISDETISTPKFLVMDWLVTLREWSWRGGRGSLGRPVLSWHNLNTTNLRAFPSGITFAPIVSSDKTAVTV